MKDPSKTKKAPIQESASREYAESIVNTVRDPLIILDQDLRVVTASRSFYEFFKVKPEETEGQLIYDLGNKQWDIPKLQELLETILPQKTTFDNYEVEHDFPIIGKRIMLLNARQIHRVLGKERIILLAIEDITERKRLESLLTESEERYRHLFETASDGIVLFEKHEGKIINTNPAAEKMLGYSKKECIGQKFQDIGVMLDMGNFQTTLQNLNKSGIIYYNNVPVKRKSGQHIDTDIYLVDKAKLVQCNIRNITDRKKAEFELRGSEERFKAIFDRASDGILLADMGTMRFYMGNKKIHQMLGYTENEFKKLGIMDIHPEADLPHVIEQFKKMERREIEIAVDIPIKRKDGSIFYADINSFHLSWADSKCLAGIFRDISERKQAEEEHKAHIRFLESLERIDQAIKEETDVEQMLQHILQTVFSIFDCDRAWLFYPCDPDAPTFRVPMEICRPEYPGAKVLNVDVPMSPDMAQNLREALASDDPVIYIAGTEKPINKVTAKQFGVQSQMFVALYPKLGKPWVFGMHHCSYPRIWTEEEKKLFKEISRRISDGLSNVLYLRELQENEARLSEAQQLAQTGSWEWDAIADTITWSEEYYRIYGFDPTQHPPGYEEHLKAYTPESAVQLDAAVKRNMQTGEPYELDLELANPKGPCRWITARSETMRDAQGKIIGLRGTAQDITERKQEEQALRETEERFAAAFHASPNLIAITRMDDGKIVDVNEGYSKMLGYSRDESIGKTTAELSIWANPADRTTFVGRLEKFGEITDFETTLRRKDGTVVTVIDFGRTIELQGEKCLLSIAHDITERKQYEESLHNVSLYTRSLIEASLDPLVTINPEGKITDLNKATEIITGISRGQLVGSDFTDYFTEPEKAKAGYQQVLSEGLVRDYPLTIKHISGNEIDVLYNATIYKNETGQVQGVFAAARDITERKRAEVEIAGVNRALRILSDTNQALIRIADEATLLNEVCRIAVEVGDYRLAWVGFAEHDEAKTLRPVAHAGFDSGYIESAKVTWADNERGRGPGGIAIRTGQPCMARNIPLDPTFAPWREAAIERGYKSIIALPLISNGQTLGVMGIYSVDTDAFNKKEVEILKEMADDLAYGISSLRTRVKRDQTEVALHESEERYRLITENTADTIAVFDLNLDPTYISPSILKLRGYPVQEAMTQTLDQMLTPDSLQLASKNFADQMALESSGTADPTRTALMELEENCKDGSTIWVELAASFLRDNNFKPIGILTVTRDITERKKAEEALKNSEEKYRNIFENAIEGIYQSTIEGRFITANAALARMAGYDSPEELIESIKDIGTQLYVHPEDRKRFLEIREAKGFVYGFEVEFYKKDGSTFWVVINARTVKDEQGEILYVEGLIEDITIRKHSEEQLHQTIDKLKKAVGTTIQVLGMASEARDPYTAGHQKRVADLARVIATDMKLPHDTIEGIRMAGSIHDIGKISIPSEILSKPTKLTNIQFSIIKEHSQIGYEMLKEVGSPWPLAEIVYQHHERMNGSGYPRNLKGDDILIEARIIAVADVVEAMASHRPYRAALGIDAALEEIEQNKGILYDDIVADTCLRLFREKGYQLS